MGGTEESTILAQFNEFLMSRSNPTARPLQDLYRIRPATHTVAIILVLVRCRHPACESLHSPNRFYDPRGKYWLIGMLHADLASVPTLNRKGWGFEG